jgi:uncharacterized protein YidB (DUF937 family)
MTALLGLLAIAGYLNRDKIAEMLRGSAQNKPGAAEQGGLGGLLAQLGLGGASAGGILGGGLDELMERFKQSGQSETAQSWVNTGPNKPCTADQLERAIGPEVLDTLSSKQVYRETSSSRGFVANCPTQWISTRHKAVYRRKPSFRAHSVAPTSSGLSLKEVGHGNPMDDPNWLYRRRVSEAHHSR